MGEKEEHKCVLVNKQDWRCRNMHRVLNTYERQAWRDGLGRLMRAGAEKQLKRHESAFVNTVSGLE
jgi:hypothetical protein